MARPTKLARDIAGELGERPATVQGWLENGYWPGVPLGRPELMAWLRELAPLMGPGRDGDVAVLKMAATGRPMARLTQLLRELAALRPDEEDTQDPDELVSDAIATPQLKPAIDALRNGARSMGTPKDLEARIDISGDGPSGYPDEPGLIELLLGSSLLPLADALTGVSLEAEDTVEMDQLMERAFVTPLGTPPAEELSPEALQFNLTVLRGIAVVAGRANAWLSESDPYELARGVEAASVLLDALTVIGVDFAGLGEEERWRTVGRLAPMSVLSLRALLAVYDAILPMLPDNVVTPGQRAFRHALLRGRTLVTESDTAIDA